MPALIRADPAMVDGAVPPPPPICPHLSPRSQDEMKDKADCFDAMVEHEEKIRLDQAGWKERYYQVHGGG